MTVQITDLPGAILGQTRDNLVLIDSNAAGHGWFVDPTPQDDGEFQEIAGLLVAPAVNTASGKIDLLTVLMHEFGHVLGNPDLDPHENTLDVMAGSLAAGTRRNPTLGGLDPVAAGHFNAGLHHETDASPTPALFHANFAALQPVRLSDETRKNIGDSLNRTVSILESVTLWSEESPGDDGYSPEGPESVWLESLLEDRDYEYLDELVEAALRQDLDVELRTAVDRLFADLGHDFRGE